MNVITYSFFKLPLRYAGQLTDVINTKFDDVLHALGDYALKLVGYLNAEHLLGQSVWGKVGEVEDKTKLLLEDDVLTHKCCALPIVVWPRCPCANAEN